MLLQPLRPIPSRIPPVDRGAPSAVLTAGALVPVAPQPPLPATRHPPRDPRLVAQLIAFAEGFDWTRVRRRASPTQAVAAYRTAAALAPQARGRVLAQI